MQLFQHKLWGYELSYPPDWTHQTLQGVEAFAATSQALEAGYSGPQSGQILVKVEWNCARQSIEPLWTRHIAMVAGLLTARQVGSAPWQMAGATGLEAEIVLPKRENRRLWTGILAYDFIVLQFLVSHLKDERGWFEPLATQLISSLRFLSSVEGVPLDDKGFPLPPGGDPMPPLSVLSDITDLENWSAYDGQGTVSALQAFYLREAPIYGWNIMEYVPFPSPSELGFARLQLIKGEQKAILGILPLGEETVSPNSPARLVIKYPPSPASSC